MRHVVMFSGGVGSWAAAKRVAERHGTDNLTLLFCDTRMEDDDLYRFLYEAAANVGGELVTLTEGRIPWEVFRDERFLKQSADPCSKILKRQIADRWFAQHLTPETCVRYVGIDWTEEHRFTRLRSRLAPWRVEAPLCEAPYVTKSDAFDRLNAEGIAPPRLYAMGFSHNNCGGFCIKAGHGHFATLLRAMPERYAYHEAQEAALRADLGPSAAVLRDRTGGSVRPMTLREFRERVEAGYEPDLFDIGGCGCFIDQDAA